MSTPAIGWCIVEVLRQGIAVLQAELPGVLSALAAEYPDLALPAPIAYWRSDTIPTDWDSPGVGLYDTGSAYIEADALAAYQVQHTVNARIVAAASQSDAEEVSSYDDALRLYAWAVSYTLQRYLALPAYAGAVGVWRCVPVSSTPTTVIEAEDRGQFLRFVDLTVQVDQRQRRLII